MPKLCSEGGRVARGFSPLFVRVYPNFYEVLFSSVTVDVDSKHVYINSYARVCVNGCVFMHPLHESTADRLKILLQKYTGNTDKNHEKSVTESSITGS
jgi:hypothetical protein